MCLSVILISPPFTFIIFVNTFSSNAQLPPRSSPLRHATPHRSPPSNRWTTRRSTINHTPHISSHFTHPAFQLLCAEALPKISYLTALDVCKWEAKMVARCLQRLSLCWPRVFFNYQLVFLTHVALLLPFSLPSFLPSFPPSFLPSFLPSLLPSCRPSFLFSCLPSFLPCLLSCLPFLWQAPEG